MSNKYLKEIKTSIESAQKYRSIINPIKAPLIIKDIDYIRNKLVRKVESDLKAVLIYLFKSLTCSAISDISCP